MTRWNAITTAMLFAGCSGGMTDETEAEFSGPPTHIVTMPIIGASSTPPPREPAAEAAVIPLASTGHGIGYGGGPIMPGRVNVYYIWYGNWSGNSATTILNDFGNNVGNSPNYFVNDGYDDNGGHHVSSSVRVGGSTNDSYSRGNNIGNGDIWTIVNSALSSGRLPVDGNAVYFVLTSADVNQHDGFCNQFCGWHTYGTFNGTNIKYSFVGDAKRCNGSCGGLGKSPNGNASADDMASIIYHELSESVTDPLLNAWGDNNGENADKCAWNFGPTYSAGNGAPANARLGSRDFLLQQNWANTGGGFCAQALPAPFGARQPSGCGSMTANQALTDGQSLRSCDGRFTLSMQYDGNLVLYQGGTALWSTGSPGSTGYAAVMQNDGNFVLYNVGQHALFASNTWGQPGNRLALQNDGNLVVYNSSGGAVWASNTCCR